jgi:hypothetical protein
MSIDVRLVAGGQQRMARGPAARRALFSDTSSIFARGSSPHEIVDSSAPTWLARHDAASFGRAHGGAASCAAAAVRCVRTRARAVPPTWSRCFDHCRTGCSAASARHHAGGTARRTGRVGGLDMAQAWRGERLDALLLATAAWWPLGELAGADETHTHTHHSMPAPSTSCFQTFDAHGSCPLPACTACRLNLGVCHDSP